MRIQNISFKANTEVAPYCFVNMQASAVIHKGDDEDKAAKQLKEFVCNHLKDFKEQVNNLQNRIISPSPTESDTSDNIPY